MEFKLGETKFQRLGYQEQLIVKERGRPMPDLNIELSGSSRGKTYKRQFNKNIYLRNNWICGCSIKNAFFCFPCVLFGIDHEEKIWRETGVTDLVHLSEKIKKHENSKTHMGNQMRLALFGNVNIQAQFDSAYWINIQKHNEEVTKNRYVLSKIIDCVKFCGAFELALRGHDESEKSENPGIFCGLVNFTSELDKTLSEHLNNATIFKGTSKNIQNDILDCILEICHDEILNEVNESPYLAVMADETTDVSAKFQMVIVLRYVTKEGTPVERFWTFVLQEKHNAGSLATTILNVIDPILINDKNKLIAQTYDGAAVRGGVQALIKQKYENAHFVHCYAHQLNLVMSKACSINSQVRVFFSALHDIPRFFTHSPQRIAVLDKIVGRNMPRSVPTRWNFNIHTVNVVYEHRDSLIECMEQLEEESNAVTCKEARGIRRILEDTDFTFWLTFFHYIMPHVDVLYNHLQKKNMDPIEAQRVVNAFEQNINNVRNKIDCIIQKASDINTASSEPKRKRPNYSKQDHRVACIEVCDIIIDVARERFAFTNHLVASSLLYSGNFEKFDSKFPDNELNITCSAYNFLNKQRLRTELSVLYSTPECRTLHGAVPFLKFIISNNLDETMTETKKLLQILVTTPMTTAEAERSFSTLRRIKTFLRNSMCQDRLTALSMLSIEKKYIASIPNFNEKVIEKFAAKKDRSIEIQFKKMKGIKNIRFPPKPAQPRSQPSTSSQDDDVIFISPTTSPVPAPLSVTTTNSLIAANNLTPSVSLINSSATTKKSPVVIVPTTTLQPIPSTSGEKPKVFLRVKSLSALQSVPSECITIPDDPVPPPPLAQLTPKDIPKFEEVMLVDDSPEKTKESPFNGNDDDEIVNEEKKMSETTDEKRDKSSNEDLNVKNGSTNDGVEKIDDSSSSGEEDHHLSLDLTKMLKIKICLQKSEEIDQLVRNKFGLVNGDTSE